MAQPATPSNTPRAHPLAPNPHTSVGLFWIYTDANTGRQWTGGTYKVKRCSGASCTPTTVVASGLTNADYQDTGLSSNTVYGYRYVANDGSDSGDSPTVYVTTLAADSINVQFPSTAWSNLLGPMVESAQIPFSWYTSTATGTGATIASKYAFVLPSGLQGTGSINNGSTTLTGSGTFFLEQVASNNPCTNRISINGVDAGTIASVNSNTSITLTTTWAGATTSGATLSTNVPQTCHGTSFGDPFNDLFVANGVMYYDSQQAFWQLYYATGDPQWARAAIKGAEALFSSQAIRQGRNRDDSFMLAPRNFQFGSLVLLGLAGRTDVWDYLDFWLTNRYTVWVSNHRANGHIHGGWNRDFSYTLHFANWFVMAAPDSFKRSDGTTTTLNGSITVDGDLTDGRKKHWKDQLDIDIPGIIEATQETWGDYLIQNLSGSYAEGDYPHPPGVSQGFMTGLTTDALGYIWRNTALATATRNSARKQVLRAAAHMALESYNTNIAADNTSARWRTIWYFFGGTRLNPYAGRYGVDTPILNNTPDPNMIAQFRQSIPLMIATLGWAYEMSGDTQYITWADEMANAAFAQIGENTGGTGDGFKSICDALMKDYGQCYRNSWKYFAMRLESPSSLGTPPVVTMPSNQTLTGGVNQASLTATVGCTNTPCTYRWSLTEFHLSLGRHAAQPMFSAETSLSTKLSGLRPGIYKVVFYAIDALGLQEHGYVNVTVGDGVFPPVVVMQKEGGQTWCTTGTSVTGISVRAYSAAGRTLTHSFSIAKPKDLSAPTVTPTSTTGNTITVDVTGLSNSSSSFWVLKDVVTDSAGTVAPAAYFQIAAGPACSGMTPPSLAHNTIPLTTAHPAHVLPTGSTSTTLLVTPVEPEGYQGFTTSVSGYTLGPNGDFKMPTALTHSWTQTAGPVSATITNGTTIRPDITGLTQSGTYTFRYTGTDQQGDTVTQDINVTATIATVTLMTANLQHGVGTDNSFGFSRQVDAMAGADIIAVQERTTGEGGWGGPMAGAGLVQAVYLENNTTEGDGPAIWYKSSTVTVHEVYSRALTTGTNPSCGSPNVGWDCTTDVRKSAVAAKVTAGGRQFYVVSVHGCWSRCNNSSSDIKSTQRENQLNDLVSWIASTLTGGLDVVILGDFNHAPDTAKTTGGLIKDILTASYTDLWNAGITASVATAPWNDRDGVGGADMPVGDLTTRTHDTRRIDYIYLKTSAVGLSLASIELPDLRVTCPHGLVAGGAFPSCSPEVQGGTGVSGQQWDIPDDFGVRPSDHNFLKVVLNVTPGTTVTVCKWSTAACQSQ